MFEIINRLYLMRVLSLQCIQIQQIDVSSGHGQPFLPSSLSASPSAGAAPEEAPQGPAVDQTLRQLQQNMPDLPPIREDAGSADTASKASFGFESLTLWTRAAILPVASQNSIYPSGQIFLQGAQSGWAKSPRSSGFKGLTFSFHHVCKFHKTNHTWPFRGKCCSWAFYENRFYVFILSGQSSKVPTLLLTISYMEYQPLNKKSLQNAFNYPMVQQFINSMLFSGR